jgi:regulator of protease activity HflC (stomatin/prohibitin superfamily)
MIVVYVLVALALVALAGLALGIRILKQYERGVLFRLGRVKGDARGPGVIAFVPFVDRVHRVSLRIVTTARRCRVCLALGRRAPTAISALWARSRSLT